MAAWNFSKSLAGTIYAPVAQGADFKRCCLKSKRYDGSLRDEDVENIVQRSLQYVAMYNTNNNFAMQKKNPFSTNGWNKLYVPAGLADHTLNARVPCSRIEDGHNGFLVDFFSPAELAAQVTEVLAHPTNHRDIGRAARKHIVANYDFHKVVLRKHVRTINKLLPKRLHLEM